MALNTTARQITRAAGLGPNADFIEASIRNGKPIGGYVEDFPILLGGWRSATGLALNATAAATPYIGNASNSGTTSGMFVVTFRQDAAAANFIQVGFQVPGQYDARTDQLYFIAAFRKYDTGVDENNTLSMQVQLRQIRMGSVNPALAAATVPSGTNVVAGDTAITSLAAPIKRILPGPVQTLDGFQMYQFDLGNDKRGTLTDALKIKPLEYIQIEVGPDATVGTTDTLIEMMGGMIRWLRNTSLHNVDRRDLLDSSAIIGPASTVARYIE